LDAALVAHPSVAVFVQFAALPGKGGKPRKSLGGIALRSGPNGTREFTFTGNLRDVTTDAAGKHAIRVELPAPPSFDMRKFRRALHHVALNGLAHHAGVDLVRERRFDPVRAYIRRPKPGEVWPFAEAKLQGPGPQLRIRFPEASRGEVIAVDLLFSSFFVGLTVDADLQGFTNDYGLHWIEPSVMTPAPAELRYIQR
jgi:hypothetical protein